MGMSWALTWLARVHQPARGFHVRINGQTFPRSYWYYTNISICSEVWNYSSTQSIWLECTFKTFHGTKMSNTQEISSNEAFYLVFVVIKQNFRTQENIQYVCQCLHRHVMMWLCSRVLCVNPLRPHHPSLTCRSTCLLQWEASHCGMPVAI